MGLPTLFRSEVLAERNTQWLGAVLLAPRLSHRLFATFALATTAALLGLLFYGQYPRKVHIGGWLVPESGLARVFAPRPGVVTKMFVQEGMQVHEGDRLLALTTEVQSAALGATGTEVIRRLTERLDSLRQERRSQDQMNQQETRSLEDRIATIGSENDKLSGEIALQRARLRSSERFAARRRAAQQAGVATEDSAQAADDERLEQAARLAALERDRLTAERTRMTLESELKAHPLQSQEKLAAIDREVATIEQQLAETEAQREIIVPAPASGTVTAIQVDRGSSTDGKVPLLSIVPTGSKLEAHMFCPSRAIGFLKAGQRVLLRYQAYPYQKFGHYDGAVRFVSRSAVNPGELPAQLSGMTSMIGPSGEPVYEITVTPASQTVAAYGQNVPLAPGMMLEADVIIERRRLVEWMLEPLFTLTGTWAR